MKKKVKYFVLTYIPVHDDLPDDSEFYHEELDDAVNELEQQTLLFPQNHHELIEVIENDDGSVERKYVDLYQNSTSD